MKFEILYHKDVISDEIPKLSKNWRITIKKAIEEKLTTQPQIFEKPLRDSLKGYRKLRVGDWRVIFCIEEDTVKILTIQHRSVVYTNIEKRI